MSSATDRLGRVRRGVERHEDAGRRPCTPWTPAAARAAPPATRRPRRPGRGGRRLTGTSAPSFYALGITRQCRASTSSVSGTSRDVRPCWRAQRRADDGVDERYRLRACPPPPPPGAAAPAGLGARWPRPSPRRRRATSVPTAASAGRGGSRRPWRTRSSIRAARSTSFVGRAVAALLGGRRSWPLTTARRAYRSSNTSVSLLPLPLRCMVPAAPTYALRTAGDRRRRLLLVSRRARPGCAWSATPPGAGSSRRPGRR